MILYHFTAKLYLPEILSDGYLRVAESNLSISRRRAGPDVVWLTKNQDPGMHSGWSKPQDWLPESIRADKTEIRFKVDVPSRAAQKWWTWARGRGIDERWARDLAAAGGSNSWYVIERPIPASEWIEITNVRTGEPVSLTAAKETAEAPRVSPKA